ncbi:MAG: helix-turn-helix domain-containing protein [Pseudomonadota bacterium]
MTADQFKEARESLGLTQTELAAKWGMGKNGERTIRRWEQGEVPVNPIAAYCIGMMISKDAAT